jgi:hypothetical protein
VKVAGVRGSEREGGVKGSKGYISFLRAERQMHMTETKGTRSTASLLLPLY